MDTKKKESIPIKKITEAYREYCGQHFGTLNQLTERYGFSLFDKIIAEEKKKKRVRR